MNNERSMYLMNEIQQEEQERMKREVKEILLMCLKNIKDRRKWINNHLEQIKKIEDIKTKLFTGYEEGTLDDDLLSELKCNVKYFNRG